VIAQNNIVTFSNLPLLARWLLFIVANISHIELLGIWIAPSLCINRA
jgi:hypothetical protein